MTALNMEAYIKAQMIWSEKTFGPGERTEGVIDHILKETVECKQAGGKDLSEWVDIIILALDGAWRAGFSPREILEGLLAKQLKNMARKWPDWRTQPADKAIEHDRSGE